MRESMPMLYDSYKTEVRDGQLISEGSERDYLCSRSSNILATRFKSVNGIIREKINDHDSYISDEKIKLFELERLVNTLTQDNK